MRWINFPLRIDDLFGSPYLLGSQHEGLNAHRIFRLGWRLCFVYRPTRARVPSIQLW